MAWLLAINLLCVTVAAAQQLPPSIQNGTGLRLLVAPENSQPTLRILLLGSADTHRSINDLFPELETARRHGVAEAEHLYLSRPSGDSQKTDWQRVSTALQYER